MTRTTAKDQDRDRKSRSQCYKSYEFVSFFSYNLHRTNKGRATEFSLTENLRKKIFVLMQKIFQKYVITEEDIHNVELEQEFPIEVVINFHDDVI